MSDTSKIGRPDAPGQPGELDAVHFNVRDVRDTGSGFALGARFDAPGNASVTLMTHALDLLLGTLFARGWRQDEQAFHITSALEWPAPWWDTPTPIDAFVAESALRPDPGAEADDLSDICGLVRVAWAMQRDLARRGAPAPELQSVFTANGLALASLHPGPLGAAMREGRAHIEARMRTLDPLVRSAAFAHVLLHLEGTPLEPWALADRPCIWESRARDAGGFARWFVVLNDTSPDPRPETARTALRMMLASGAGA